MTRIVVKNAALFDGHEIHHPDAVVFRGSPGNILSVEVGSHTTPTNTDTPDTIIDATGCTLLPAFMDADIDSAAASTCLQTFASFGIATVLDMSSTTAQNQAMRAASADDAGLPNYLASGAIGVGPDSALLRLIPLRNTVTIRTAKEAEDFVNDRINGPDRADFIKATVELPGIDEAILSVLVRVAHRHGKLAVAHTSCAAAFSLAMRAGFDILTHAPIDKPLSAAVAAQAAKQGVVCVPVLSLMRRIEQEQNQKQHGHVDFGHALASVRALHDAGVGICAGTGTQPTRRAGVPLGQGLHDELELLVRAGFAPVEALRAATSVPSRAFKLRDRGLVRPGQRADLLLVEGNPLEDITATRRIRRVWIKGIELEEVAHDSQV